MAADLNLDGSGLHAAANEESSQLSLGLVVLNGI